MDKDKPPQPNVLPNEQKPNEKPAPSSSRINSVGAVPTIENYTEDGTAPFALGCLNSPKIKTIADCEITDRKEHSAGAF